MSTKRYLRTPYLAGEDVATKRKEIADYFNATWQCYESLFETLADDKAYYHKSVPLRHPLIFYYGHTATFFVNKLVLAGLIERINPRFESMFAIGVDEMSWDDLDEEHYDWPTVKQVRDYRKQVKQRINDIIANAPLSLPIDWDNPWWTILMGIEHEQIHIETSSVLIRQQNIAWIKEHSDWQSCTITAQAPQNELVAVPAGDVSLGKEYSDPYYGWDNEYGVHQATISDFKASRFLVSNQQFFEFM